MTNSGEQIVENSTDFIGIHMPSVGVGFGVLIIAIIALLIFLWCGRKWLNECKKKRTNVTSPPPVPNSNSDLSDIRVQLNRLQDRLDRPNPSPTPAPSTQNNDLNLLAIGLLTRNWNQTCNPSLDYNQQRQYLEWGRMKEVLDDVSRSTATKDANIQTSPPPGRMVFGDEDLV